jgi:hypothetical protein
MSATNKQPPQQGFAWRDEWQDRLERLLRQRGLSSASDYASLHPTTSFVALAKELGPGDVAAIQLEWMCLDEAKQSNSVERCARDFLTRILHEFIPGWPRSDDPSIRKRLASGLAAWSSMIGTRLPGYSDATMEMALAALDDSHVPVGWLPTSPDDPVLLDMFARHWNAPQPGKPD